MPILNMVGGGKKGGNIGEPLNLTVTTSGLDATIKWEDNEIGTIPPTTFQKSELVRKIGSAPTSPSDGDLVVTETVKDTYKTTGYVDQGLTDGETYYYRVFSYSDLGGISYCDAISITASTPYQPGVDTIAYYPFKGDVENKVDGATATMGSGSSIGSDYATLNASIITCPMSSTFDATSSFTFSIWTNYYQISYNPRIVRDNSTNPFCLTIEGTHTNNPLAIILNWNPDENANYVGKLSGINAWNNIIVAYPGSGTNVYVYVNGVKYTYTNGFQFQRSSNNLVLGNDNYPDYAYFYIADMIIETKQRTDIEALDYYNKTKGDYGL